MEEQARQDKGGMKGSRLLGAASVGVPLDIEAWRDVGKSGFRQFYQIFREHRLFVSVYENNNNTLHINTNCKIL